MQEYFKILGLNIDASDEEIENAYQTLKNQYSRDRFLEGELGNIAAKNLTKLENAYREIQEYKKQTAKSDYDKTISFVEVENLIKEGNISSAQIALDNISDRTAEWHYLQSCIYYKKNWINDCKRQLEIALKLEPNNVKYIQTHKKLMQTIAYNDNQFRGGANYNQQQPNANRQMGGTDTNGCADFCLTWCCMNMALNMCCNCR